MLTSVETSQTRPYGPNTFSGIAHLRNCWLTSLRSALTSPFSCAFIPPDRNQRGTVRRALVRWSTGCHNDGHKYGWGL
jgi:hypothetical protein